MVNEHNLFWLDLEMTGLDPHKNHIIEIASIVTNKQLEIIQEGPSLVIQQPETRMQNMNNTVRDMHTQSGLLNRVAASKISLSFAEQQTIAFFKKWCIDGITILCGNSIWVDRSFLKQYMPTLEVMFHYRMIDVSSFKEVVKRWYPEDTEFKKEKRHTALADIRESITELHYYKKTYWKGLSTSHLE